MREPQRITPETKQGKLAAFGRWCLDQLRGEVCGIDLDGGAAQDQAVALGLLVEVTVDKPCGDDCACAEYYDEFPVQCLREVADD